MTSTVYFSNTEEARAFAASLQDQPASAFTDETFENYAPIQLEDVLASFDLQNTEMINAY